MGVHKGKSTREYYAGVNELGNLAGYGAEEEIGNS
jgi:hypothetical protein